MSIPLFAFSRCAVMAGLALWLSIAAWNNFTDPGTNRFHIGNTLSMALLQDEAVLGAALRWRAWPAHWAGILLYAIAAAQSLVAALLWHSAFTYAAAWRQRSHQALNLARHRAVIALTGFLMLWLAFICGGLWFGYWMKQGAIQSVHLTLILMGFAALSFVYADPVGSSANAPLPNPT